MNVHLQNIPYGVSTQKAEREFRHYTNAIGAYAFNMFIRTARGNKQNPRNKQQRYATVTFPSPELAEKFLKRYGKPNGPRSHPREQIKIKQQVVNCCVDKYPIPKEGHMVQALELKQAEAIAKIAKDTPVTRRKRSDRKFLIQSFQYGIWAAEPASPDTLEFVSYQEVSLIGTLNFRRRSADIELNGHHKGEERKFTLSMDYYWMYNIVTDSHRDIFFYLKYAPKIYRDDPAMMVDPDDPDRTEKCRISGLDKTHEALAGFANVYRVRLDQENDHNRVVRLNEKDGIPPIVSKTMASRAQPAEEFGLSMVNLVQQLQKSNVIPFTVAFHLHTMAANNILSPDSVSLLVPRVAKLVSDFGEDAAVDIMSYFVNELGVDCNPVNTPNLLCAAELQPFLEDHINWRLKQHVDGYLAKVSTKREENGLAMVRSALITPTGVYAFGPIPEAQNRVLRKYEKFHDYFLRVNFIEEDGDPFHHERGVNNSEIYLLYRKRLEIPIVIAGREFRFLGFSSSSLKSQGCWFMAEFIHEGLPMTPQALINELGNFDAIRTPGRYAARVGQAFSDTINSVRVKLDQELIIDDIKRNDRKDIERCFSDGIGKVSYEMVNRIWKESERINRDEATVFQIRYAGAKGMICLDPKIPGDQLHLRKSMIKFEGSDDRNIEICTWGKRMELYLNKPMVKVLEDLGVGVDVFLQVQEEAVSLLRQSSESPHMAGAFFRRYNVSAQILKLDWVVGALAKAGIVFWEDPFLEKCYELALMMALRGIKYRARIPIKKGFNLIGVLDETGYLEEGEIYASYEDGDETVVLRGDVVITRSPMYHPGDIQVARAIDVPELSPLRFLKNCVAFSSKGDRPLPSMLSGGDLDGGSRLLPSPKLDFKLKIADLYNIILDKRLYPTKHSAPADYPSVPPLKLAHPVTLTDIADFFINFMQNDMLGIIANRHLVIADQTNEGVWHPDCIRLSEMASAAVDFPKTGVPIAGSMPKAPSRNAKPDFMAPGPRVLISKSKIMNEQEPEELDEDEPPAQLWYRSEKALGKLYRAIDEEGFIAQIRVDIQAQVPRGGVIPPLEKLWSYMQHHAGERYPNWNEYIKEAYDIQDQYENELKNTMVQCSETPWNSTLTEEEVFIGTLLGKHGNNKRNFSITQNMRTEYEELAMYTVKRIKGEDREHTFHQGMACLNISLPSIRRQRRQDRQRDRGQVMHSFGWVVASVLLNEVDSMQKDDAKNMRINLSIRNR